jgi:hypothetical protein
MGSTVTIGDMESEVANLDTAFMDVQVSRDIAFKAHWNNKYDAGSLKAASQAASDATDKSLLESLHQRRDVVCSFYLETDDGERRWMREEVAQLKAISRAVEGHVYWCADHLTTSLNSELA